jgi:hypothetical protein
MLQQDLLDIREAEKILLEHERKDPSKEKAK